MKSAAKLPGMESLHAPHTFPRRILLAATGLSPPIVTETLYALVTSGSAPFAPTGIHLITTVQGARLARAALLHPDGGQFHALLRDYPAAGRPRFDESHIHIVRDTAGAELADIRTPEENSIAADAIAALVGQFTADDQSALHVSIAGGRKTMGFYLGYAFSLYARPQDRLSHVLVNAPFEAHPEFFYPPVKPRRLASRTGGHIDTADAVVSLAEIPVVRLRHGLPRALQQRSARFSEAVAAIQASLAPPELAINLKTPSAACGGMLVPMKPQLLAWFTWWAWLAQRQPGAHYLHWSEAKEKELGAFLAIYRTVVGRNAPEYVAASKRLAAGMEKEFFQENNSKLERSLKDALGPIAVPYLLRQLGERPHTRRGLDLDPASIHLAGLPERMA